MIQMRSETLLRCPRLNLKISVAQPAISPFQEQNDDEDKGDSPVLDKWVILVEVFADDFRRHQHDPVSD